MDKFTDDPDVQLMLQFKGGDNASFEALLEKYHPAIINFFYRFVGDREEAEDLAQEVFLRVYRSRQKYKPMAKFSTWIYCIAKNLALNELRRRQAHKASSLDEMVKTEEQDVKLELAQDTKNFPSCEVEKKELEFIVKEAVNSLPEKQKIAVVLRKYNEFSYEEIARVMGCSVSAVKSLLNRAKTGLKEKLVPYLKS